MGSHIEQFNQLFGVRERQLEAMLKELEWAWDEDKGYYCQFCEGDILRGHKENCKFERIVNGK